MKIQTSVLVLMMTMCPLVGRAQLCTDFDDDMNIIEYDCSRSLADVKREMSEAKAKAEAAAAAAKAKAEAEEKVRIAAEKAAKEKAEAEEKARQAAEKARIAAEKKAAAERAKAEKEARRIACVAPQTWLFGRCTDMALKYFVAGGATLIDIDSNFTPSGFNAEIGTRLDPLKNNWYYTFSVMGQTASDKTFFWMPTDNGVAKIPSYDMSLQSLYLTAGVGYKFWRVFDVYGKIAPGAASMSFKGGSEDMDISKTTFDIAGILGLNARLYKWLHIYGEAQLSMNQPIPGAITVQYVPGFGGDYYMSLPEKKIDTDTVLMLRGGVKLVF